MLSVCIPVYNHTISELISDLLSQLSKADIKFEIVIIDDASLLKYKKVNDFLRTTLHLTYIELDENIGRSAIRNLFLNYVKYENLLFLDCDSKLVSNQFIKNYIKKEVLACKVVCGGRVYAKKPRKAKLKLRWKYGVKRECLSAEKRVLRPYHSFMTNNFLVKKSLLEAIRFDERLKGYGHEDSLFGYELMKKNAEILHINNPTVHIYDETTYQFLAKTRQGIENLYFINKEILPNGEFAKVNRLLSTYLKHKKKKTLLFLASLFLMSPVALLFRMGIVPVKLFDLYKLLYFARLSFADNETKKQKTVLKIKR